MERGGVETWSLHWGTWQIAGKHWNELDSFCWWIWKRWQEDLWSHQWQNLPSMQVASLFITFFIITFWLLRRFVVVLVTSIILCFQLEIRDPHFCFSHNFWKEKQFRFILEVQDIPCISSFYLRIYGVLQQDWLDVMRCVFLIWWCVWLFLWCFSLLKSAPNVQAKDSWSAYTLQQLQHGPGTVLWRLLVHEVYQCVNIAFQTQLNAECVEWMVYIFFIYCIPWGLNRLIFFFLCH